MLGGEAVYRGHEGVRDFLRDVWQALDDTHFEFREIREIGDRVVAIGHFRGRGKASGAETKMPFAYVGDFKDGKAIQVRGYLDPNEALEAAGRSE
jgi:ketosteroid isomerase-like protein